MTDAMPGTAPLSVLLVDPDDRVRESLAGLLRIGQRLQVVGSAGTPDAAIELTVSHLPDVIVVDPRLPGLDDAAALIARIRIVSPASRVLVLNWSETTDEEGCGADAYTRKTFRPHELIDAVVSTSRRELA
jgi:DNA-binding NarL/FixJ family response regulator